jgi:probable rRNA maturation factor
MKKFDIELLILNESSFQKTPLDKREMTRVVRETLRAGHLTAGSYEVSVYIVDDIRMRELNEEYRNLRRTTDVLSFPQYESTDELDPGKYGRIVLGDVVIAHETLNRRCGRRGEDLIKEYARVLIHGTLHLAGFDHATRAQREHMRKSEEAVIDTIFR